MNTRKATIAGAIGAGAVALGIGAATVASAGGGHDPEHPITGREYERASRVALQTTGGGKVTQTEKGDEEGAYEVEVRRADATSVDVHLDQDFHVIDQKPDGQADTGS
ncbi:MAG: hypothetical protein JWN29_1637 [Acidimicrobiales bacterium]|nr:hypothetical protein [Acidimicrobiales bacterium]MCU1378654.1 hypothetical protein [Acidimicrobiales bacterium]